MKALRRSIKGDKETRSPHISVSQKSAMAITAPKKVIKALHDYEPTGSDQLAFQKGDFFHVVSREDDENWYEACNPATGAKGLVPVQFFQSLGKNEAGRDRMSGSSITAAGQAAAHDSAYSGSSESLPAPTMRSRNSTSVRHSTAYGMVQYDFNAERPDELQAKAGEYVIIIAQSTEEWYVAKPIGRLGGPGLIPVAYIELKNMANGKSLNADDQAAARAAIPPVEEWKKTQADYKNSSIPLGRIDDPSYASTKVQNGGAVQSHLYQNGQQYSTTQQQGDHHQVMENPDGEPVNGYSSPRAEWNDLPAPTTASIPRYCHSEDKFWFVVEAQMDDGSFWQFSRFYEDFYDLQVVLLGKYVDEAGRRGGPRVIPYLPGPMPYVTDALTKMRQGQLNEYLLQLLVLDPRVSHSVYVKGFFSPREGDFELDPDAPTDFNRYSQQSMGSNHVEREFQSSQPTQHVHVDRDAGSSRQQQQQEQYQTNGNGNMDERRFSYSQHQSATVGVAGSQQSGINGYHDPQELSSSQQSLLQNGSQAAAIKFKVHFEDNIYVVRVPPEINFIQLKKKVLDRCNVQHDIEINYRDEARAGAGLVPMVSERDWTYAVQNTEKLGLYVS